jgi:hypothetical protein
MSEEKDYSDIRYNFPPSEVCYIKREREGGYRKQLCTIYQQPPKGYKLLSTWHSFSRKGKVKCLLPSPMTQNKKVQDKSGEG